MDKRARLIANIMENFSAHLFFMPVLRFAVLGTFSEKPGPHHHEIFCNEWLYVFLKKMNVAILQFLPFCKKSNLSKSLGVCPPPKCNLDNF